MAFSRAWWVLLAVSWEFSWGVVAKSSYTCCLHVAWDSRIMAAGFPQAGHLKSELERPRQKLLITHPQKSQNITSTAFY